LVLCTLHRSPRSTLFPYTTLFRSWIAAKLCGSLAAGILLLSSIAVSQGADVDEQAEHEFFEAKIRPLLVSRCYACHSAETKPARSEEHTSELQSRENLVCRLLLEK